MLLRDKNRVGRHCEDR